MRINKVSSAAALVVVAALGLSACGSGGSKPADKIKTASPSKPSKKASGPSSSTAGDAKYRPQPKLPAGFTMSFSPSTTGDAKKDAVLKDDELFWRAANQSWGDYNTEGPYNAYVGSSDAAKWVGEGVTMNKKHNTMPTGQDRFYNRRVTFGQQSGTATVAECEYQGKAFNKDKKTGKVQTDAPSDDSYLYYIMQHTKDDHGVWRTASIYVKQKAVAQCKG